MITNNYFAAEGDILERLRTSLDGHVQAESIFSVTDVDESFAKTVATPAVYVSWAGHAPQPDKVAGKGKKQAIVQRWLVVLVVSNSGFMPGVKPRDKAGPLLVRIMKALGGFTKNQAEYDPLIQEPSPGPIYKGAYSEFPLVYSTTVTLIAD